MGIKNVVSKINQKAADKVAKAAKLSPEQLKAIDDKRREYLQEMPDPKDKRAEEMTDRLLAACGGEIYNAYLPQLSQLYVPAERTAEYGVPFHRDHNIRYFQITKWVTDKKENNLEKLVNVYEVLSNENCNIALIFHRTMKGTEVYLSVTDTDNGEDNVDANNMEARLADALHGNFPGAEVSDGEIGTPKFLKKDGQFSVATASNIPTEKSEKFISQTIEKLLDGNVPDRKEKEYTLILMATPILDIEERKLRLAEIYSGLAPYAGWQTNYTYNEQNAVGSSATFGVNVGVSAGIQNGTNQSTTNTQGEQNSEQNGESQAVSDAEQHSKQHTKNSSESNETSHQTGRGTNKGSSEGTSDSVNTTETVGTTESEATGEMNGGSVGADISVGPEVFKAGVNGAKYSAETLQKGTSTAKSTAHGVANTVSRNISESVSNTVSDAASHAMQKGVADTVGEATTRSLTNTLSRTLGKAVTKSTALTSGIFKAVNYGVNFGANFARTSNVTTTIGRGQGIIQNYTNYNIKHALELLEEQMKRYEMSTALGMWDFAAYVISEDSNVANNVAHDYVALTQGEKSYMSHAAINLWRGDTGDQEERERVAEIYAYLQDLRQPVFGLNPELTDYDETFKVYPSVVTATTPLSGKELAYSLNFPQKSVTGLPVIPCTEFSRNVVTYDTLDQGTQIKLGHVFHMYHDEDTDVKISLQSLTSHAFVTGSTGSGKSNTIYQIINNVGRTGVKFLVIEPAKGEYKNMFGMDSDVSVYGTNPDLSPMLRINPFSFPKGIHILEHLDRLVEIFNVCWPMYAAMPAVLKSAIERSYEDAGWDLTHSRNPYGENLYPTFADVTRNVRTIIDESDYDAENKGAYKGSLLMRLESLTNGINGMVFVQDEIPAEQLFDENVIIDLSRVGSMETKSLLMGMLIIKLQEYRMVSGDMNADLKHLTVLEEAHNLLKRTSTEQVSESANLAGKSVEMISNAIAEMRTYGEGFVIVDQAPGLLDLAAIRNTNTKIILRLPDEEDRELVGSAANLNKDQIRELGRLPRGVAAVYQNEWIEPILCRVDKFDRNGQRYVYTPDTEETEDNHIEERVRIATMISRGEVISDRDKLKELQISMQRYGIPSTTQIWILNLLRRPSEPVSIRRFAPAMAGLFPEVLETVKRVTRETPKPEEWTRAAERTLVNIGAEFTDDQARRDVEQSIITYYWLFVMNNDQQHLKDWQMQGGLR